MIIFVSDKNLIENKDLGLGNVSEMLFLSLTFLFVYLILKSENNTSVLKRHSKD